MKFIGRESELKQFKEAFESEKYEGILVYGRRRVGKSEMVKEAVRLSGISSVYYECKKVSEASNTLGLAEVIS